MYYAYVLFSDSHKVFYKGMTSDISLRIEQHNKGLLGIYTKNKGPWKLVYFEEFELKSEALKRERF